MTSILRGSRDAKSMEVDGEYFSQVVGTYWAGLIPNGCILLPGNENGSYVIVESRFFNRERIILCEKCMDCISIMNLKKCPSNQEI